MKQFVYCGNTISIHKSVFVGVRLGEEYDLIRVAPGAYAKPRTVIADSVVVEDLLDKLNLEYQEESDKFGYKFYIFH